MDTGGEGDKRHVVTAHGKLDEILTPRAHFPALLFSHTQNLLILRTRRARIMRLLALFASPKAAAATVSTSRSKATPAGVFCAQILRARLGSTVRASRITNLNGLLLKPRSETRSEEALNKLNGDMCSAAPRREQRFVTQRVVKQFGHTSTAVVIRAGGCLHYLRFGGGFGTCHTVDTHDYSGSRCNLNSLLLPRHCR